MVKSKSSTVKTIRDNLSSIDLFTLDVQFRENGKENFSTNFGMILSILILILTCLYANVKITAFVNDEETTHQTSENIGGLNESDIKFDFDETQFAIQAVAITFDGEINDPDTNQSYTFSDMGRMFDLVTYTLDQVTDEIDNIEEFPICSE